MSDFQFWLNLGVQIFVGVVLVLTIKHRNSLIETLKEQSNSAKAVLDCGVPVNYMPSSPSMLQLVEVIIKEIQDHEF